MSKKNKPLPDLAHLRECFILNEDGSLAWRHRPLSHFQTPKEWRRWNTRNAGRTAGNIGKGYRTLSINGSTYLAHRIVFYMDTGIDPLENLIDHRDLDTTNNRPSNLRLASREQNYHNAPISANNTSGIKGVCWDAIRSRWLAQIMHKGTKHAARFDTIEAAANWVKAIRSGLHGEFARHA